MKKILLISVAFWGIPVMVQAEEPPCEQLDSSWCGRHGYTETSCNEGYTAIRCPFDNFNDNTAEKHFFCHRSQVKNCKVGDILWSDNNCYVLETGLVSTVSGGTCNPGDSCANAIINVTTNVIPKGVVFDDVNKLAVGLKTIIGGTTTDPELLKWQMINISGLSIPLDIDTTPHPYLYYGDQKYNDNHNYTGCDILDGSDAMADYCSVICNLNDSNVCRDAQNDDEDCTHAIGESCQCDTYYTCPGNGGRTGQCRRSKGCKIAGMGDPGNFRVPTEGLISVGTGTVTGVIGFSAGPSRYATTSATRGGWRDTVRLRKGTTLGSGQLGFSAPAAMACYELNTSFTSCPNEECANDTGGEVGAGHVWFLPSSGDLVKLVDNYALVKEALTKAYVSKFSGDTGDSQSYNSSVGAVLASENNDYYWSSTQASQSGYYNRAYAVKLEESTSTDSCGVTTTTYSSTMESKGRSAGNSVVCVYHYGDDWDMSSYADLWTNSTQTQQWLPSSPQLLDSTRPLR